MKRLRSPKEHAGRNGKTCQEGNVSKEWPAPVRSVSQTAAARTSGRTRLANTLGFPVAQNCRSRQREPCRAYLTERRSLDSTKATRQVSFHPSRDGAPCLGIPILQSLEPRSPRRRQPLVTRLGAYLTRGSKLGMLPGRRTSDISDHLDAKPRAPE